MDAAVEIGPGETAVVMTGLAFEFPEGHAGLVCARSGLATKKGLAPANKVGVIDSDYRGELMVALLNHGPETQTVLPGDRIAQLVVVPVVLCDFQLTDSLGDTARGDGGFGSTGRN
jgi:dUTP pyrophosphatase